jgi:spore germination protein YaaH
MINKIILSICIAIAANTFTYSQTIKPIHQEHLEFHNALSDTEISIMYTPASMPHSQKQQKNCTLTKKVFGYHPYWSNGMQTNYNWNLISDLCYFSWEFSPTTGNVTNSHSWATAQVVTDAHNNGVRVHLCVPLFNSHEIFLTNMTARNNMINNLITAMNQRNAIGVNIDFESVPGTQRDSITAFMIQLSNSVKAAIPGAIISIALPAVDWGNVWNIPVLKNYVDWFVIMGYDYYYASSSQAGPVGPTYSFTTTYDRNLSRSTTYYLHAGVHKDSLIMAIPYYGREWSTVSNAVPSNTISNISSRFYNFIRNNPTTYNNRQWEPNSLNPYYVFHTGTEWRQCWVDDEISLKRKYDLINIRDIGGVGIWALGYDDGYTELWDALEVKFTTCAVVPCTDTIWDLGGPGRNYYNNESFTYTISPTNATGLSLNFTSFSLENGWDTLFIYNGNSSAAPLIGHYTGSNSPNLIHASGNSLTLRFKSDNATVAAGWQAIWQCVVDNVPPTTIVDVTSGWKTNDFTTHFIDNDNIQLKETFYNIAYFDTNHDVWLSNGETGFLNEQFQGTTTPNWSLQTGNWAIDAGTLKQSLLSNSNTNAFIYTQPSATSHVFLYHWKMRIGAGDATNNRRAGLHYFSDNPSATERGNSYFVYYRVENAKVQMYKTVGNVFQLKTNVDYPFQANTWYDLKILYNKQTGLHQTFINNQLVSWWIDDTPLQNGNGLSLRTGNCEAWYDDIRVYQSRGTSQLIAIGDDPLSHIKFQNHDPLSPAGIIRSIVIDNVNLWSTVDSVYVNVDWTPPVGLTSVYDGIGVDVDTIYTQTEASVNWSLTNDPHSGMANYFFGLGTAPGLDDIVAMSSNGVNIVATLSGLNLNWGDTVYFTVYAVNNAGLASVAISSDGLLVYDPTTMQQDNQSFQFALYPNPVDDVLNIAISNSYDFSWIITNMEGKIILTGSSCNQIQVNNLSSGMYYIIICNVNQTAIQSFLKK